MKKLGALFVTLLILLLVATAAGCTANPAANSDGQPTAAPAEIAQPTAEPAEPGQPAAEPMETAQPAGEALPAGYAEILAQYADAEANDFYQSVDASDRDAAFGADTALEWRVSPRPAQYALCDLDGDGTEELIIAAAARDGASVNYDLWGLSGDTAVRLIDLDFGYRATFAVYADGLIAVTFSNSAFESGVDWYRVHGAEVISVASFVTESSADDPDTLVYLVGGAPLSQEEWEAKLAEMTEAGLLELAFLPVAG